MENDTKSLIIELTPLYAQSVWRSKEKNVQTMKLAFSRDKKSSLISLLLYIVTKIETRT